MDLTATYTQIQFGSQVAMCQDISLIEIDKDGPSTIAIFKNPVQRLPDMHILYQEITSYNGAIIIPLISDLITQLRAYANGLPPVYIETPTITVSAIPPVDPAIHDIWIDVS
jgi:hypothetical protein